MSLFKQLWLSVIALMLLAVSGSLVVSSLKAKGYLEEQLYLKNVDNATSLALSLSQVERDPVLWELMIAAQFDSGHYRYIRLEGADGEPIVERRDDQAVADVPEWFMALLPIRVDQGIAQVSSGWNQVGTLTLRSHDRFAYRELWESSQQVLIFCFAAALLSGLVGSLILRFILRPLHQVVAQAQAIGDRRFVTTEEPRTPEFREVVISMNGLAERIRQMLAKESLRLEQFRRQTQFDTVTGMFNRDHFLSRFQAVLDRNDETSSGVLVIFRIGNLAELNRSEGWGVMDALLAAIGEHLNGVVVGRKVGASGRLNGSDFAVLVPSNHETPLEFAERLQQELHQIASSLHLDEQLQLPAAVTHYHAGEQASQVMQRVDEALVVAQERDARNGLESAAEGVHADRHKVSDWEQQLTEALQHHRVRSDAYPVVTMEGQVLYQELYARLQLASGEWLSAGQFLPWVARFQQAGELDLEMIRLALARVSRDGEDVGVNLSAQVLASPKRMEQLFDLLRSAQGAAAKLWLELPESVVFEHFDAFKTLCTGAHSMGCQVGIEHFGHEFSRIGELHDVGLHYIKIDSDIVHGVDSNSDNQSLLRQLLLIVHSAGLLCIAEGVRSDEELEMLKTIGLDGVAGPAAAERKE